MSTILTSPKVVQSGLVYTGMCVMIFYVILTQHIYATHCVTQCKFQPMWQWHRPLWDSRKRTALILPEWPWNVAMLVSAATSHNAMFWSPLAVTSWFSAGIQSTSNIAFRWACQSTTSRPIFTQVSNTSVGKKVNKQIVRIVVNLVQCGSTPGKHHQVHDYSAQLEILASCLNYANG